MNISKFTNTIAMTKYTRFFLKFSVTLLAVIIWICFQIEYCHYHKFNEGEDTANISIIEEKQSQFDIVYPSWLSKCTDVYLDIGSNIGVQIKKLFEPEKYNYTKLNKKKKVILNKVLNLYTDAFGLPRKRNKKFSGLCALGFEPNPKHQAILKKLEISYSTKGWKVHFFPYAVTNKNTFLTFYSNQRNQVDDGASLYKTNKIKKQFTVRSISLSDFIKNHFKNVQIKLVKLDIEGSEFEVLTDLLLKGMLCQEQIKTMYVEFHDSILKKNSYTLKYKSSGDLMKKIQSQQTCNCTKILVIDDESFSFDTKIAR